MEVPATDVIDVYRRLLSEANHKIAILEAQLTHTQRRQEVHDDNQPGRSWDGGSSSSQ